MSTEATLTIHNLSNFNFEKQELDLLHKGLSFAPIPQTPLIKQQLQLLKQFDNFAKTIRKTYVNSLYRKTNTQRPITNLPICAYVYRTTKFLPKQQYTTMTETYSGVNKVEQYIEQTKENIDEQLPDILKHHRDNITKKERQTLKKLKTSKSEVTIKPADKNLGVVILNTNDYIQQCMLILSDSNTYRLTSSYPQEQIREKLTNLLIKFKPHLHSLNKNLHEHLQPKRNCQTPQLYGLPKIHKQFDHLPPLRPIISHCNSMLNPTARLLDHCLQPLAQSYPDYLHNSTTLSLILEDLHVPDDAFLVSIDVDSLYPSIPQTECLQVIYEEMHKHRHLLLSDPNFLIRLLHLNINYNYFEYGTLVFQQIHGTAMGAAFSPTIANIYMSIFLNNFLTIQQHKPLLLKRYIDDILVIWTHTKETLQNFLSALNNFHPSLHFTFSFSQTSTNYLDLTIYKGHHFLYTNKLDTKTYQKQQNLYQYLHFNSNHTHELHKAIITGECIRYVRTNTTESNYKVMIHLFRERLVKRSYPKKFIDKAINSVSYKDRQRHLTKDQQSKIYVQRPILKCLPPLQYRTLKQLILTDYGKLNIPTFRIVTLGHKTRTCKNTYNSNR